MHSHTFHLLCTSSSSSEFLSDTRWKSGLIPQHSWVHLHQRAHSHSSRVVSDSLGWRQRQRDCKCFTDKEDELQLFLIFHMFLFIFISLIQRSTCDRLINQDFVPGDRCCCWLDFSFHFLPAQTKWTFVVFEWCKRSHVCTLSIDASKYIRTNWTLFFQETVWKWSDGSQFDFTNWGNGQPDNSGGGEDCMEINRGGTNWKWACWWNVFGFYIDWSHVILGLYKNCVCSFYIREEENIYSTDLWFYFFVLILYRRRLCQRLRM